MQICIDIDGTVCNTHKKWLELYNQRFGDNVKVSDITDWDIMRFLKPECTPSYFFSELLARSYDSSPAFTGARDVIARLKKEHEVIFVTSGVFQEKTRWMIEKGFSGGYVNSPDNIIIARNKQLVKGDVMIDDYPENLTGWKHGILFDRPWNESNKVFPRASSWVEVERMIRRLQ